jgi:hypothetical protein
MARENPELRDDPGISLMPKSVLEVPIFYIAVHEDHDEIDQAVASFQQAEAFPWPDHQALLIGEETIWRHHPEWSKGKALLVCFRDTNAQKWAHLGGECFTMLRVIEETDKSIRIDEHMMLLRRENLADEGDFKTRQIQSFKEYREHTTESARRAIDANVEKLVREAEAGGCDQATLRKAQKKLRADLSARVEEELKKSIEQINYEEEATLEYVSETSPDWHWVVYDLLAAAAHGDDIWDKNFVPPKEIRDEVTGMTLIRAFCNLVVPCHYYVKTTFPEGFGPKKFARAIRGKPMFSMISFDRLHAICPETQGMQREAHWRRGHYRYLWKRAGLNRFALPDSPAQRFELVRRFKVDRVYIQPTWIGPRSFVVDGVQYEIDPEVDIDF